MVCAREVSIWSKSSCSLGLHCYRPPYVGLVIYIVKGGGGERLFYFIFFVLASGLYYFLSQKRIKTGILFIYEVTLWICKRGGKQEEKKKQERKKTPLIPLYKIFYKYEGCPRSPFLIMKSHFFSKGKNEATTPKYERKN